MVESHPRESSVLLHLDEVEGAVEAAVELAVVDREGELLVQQVEHHVVLKQAGRAQFNWMDFCTGLAI